MTMDIGPHAAARRRSRCGRLGCDHSDGPIRTSTQEDIMKASIGDRIVIEPHHIGEGRRDCQVLEVRGPDGGSPYFVRWGDSGHEALFYPGSDASVQHFGHPAPQETPASH